MAYTADDPDRLSDAWFVLFDLGEDRDRGEDERAILQRARTIVAKRIILLKKEAVSHEEPTARKEE